MIELTFNPGTREEEAGGSLWVPGQPRQHSKFQDNQDLRSETLLKTKAPNLKRAICMFVMLFTLGIFLQKQDARICVFLPTLGRAKQEVG